VASKSSIGTLLRNAVQLPRSLGRRFVPSVDRSSIDLATELPTVDMRP
jgi:hypothetical protein